MDEKILKRLEHEKKAQKIVERLAEETVDPVTFNSLSKLIEPYHYEEIVDERFLALTCGYPTCSNVLKDIPKQKYQISTKSNKVYDITYRKKFCSNNCYLTSNVLKSKISTVPIWSRENPSSKPVTQYDKYELESLERNKMCLERDEEVIARSKLSSTEIENELREIEREWKMRGEIIAQKHIVDQLPFKEPKVVEKTNETPQINKNLSEIKEERSDNKEEEDGFMTLEKIFGAEQIIDVRENQIKLIEKVLNAIFVSLTKESRVYLLKLGKSDVKKQEIDVEMSKMSLNEDKKDERKTVELSALIKDPVLEAKMRNFFNPQQWQNEFGDEKKKVRFEGIEDASKNDKGDELMDCPLVDEYCQLQIRQHLFFEKVCKNLDAIFRNSAGAVGPRIGEIKKELRPLIKTLNLSNKTFNFRPDEWILVAIFMLNLLHFCDEQLDVCIRQDKYYLALVKSCGLSCEKLAQILQFMILK